MGSDLVAEKRRVRSALSQLRRSVAPERAADAAARIAARLLAEPALRRARRVALYAALPDEVPTRPLFDALRAQHASLLLPRSEREGSLAFVPIGDWSELRPGRYGVLEPAAAGAAMPPEQEDVVLVPGVAFDRAGNRLGRGRGCYDRAFPRSAPRPPILIGVAYAIQLLASVPHGDGDRRMDAVVTEDELLWCAGASA